ncbi:cation-translocating P-type ATPase [Achromobacter mucicolens]|uniref:Calcium-transporting ATPase 1 n=1 Tax=Achromobacter mucicolens TaxID=1389922 RepID=A0ABM8LM29_9BURK|nr:cation-translocating P-type ATPase [Achromobacter mucicolens]CAB3920784.1 Calcium-transporting ATPase 1 [Achromobacter mucicolens]
MPSPDHQRTLASISLDLVKDPMFALLLAGGGLYTLLGAWQEAALLLLFVLVIFALTVAQSLRTARALDALDRLAAPRALLLRDGKRHWVPSADLKPGDAVLLAEGNRVPADGRLTDGEGLLVDESPLTGEFQPVYKRPSGTVEGDAEVLSGTLVLSGTGTLRVLAVGDDTRLGALGQSMRQLTPERAPLELQTRHFILRFMWVGFFLSLATWALYVYMRGGWFEGMLAGIALAMSLLPQDFPVIVTIFSALEARRIAGEGVLVRKLSVVETLGKTTVLCADKTGTMTTNTMVVRALYAGSVRIDAADLAGAAAADCAAEAMTLAETLALASVPDSGDAMEDAFRIFAASLGGHPPAGGLALVKTYPFSSARLAVIHVWAAAQADDARLACKGAPEAVFKLCQLSPARTAQLQAEVQRMAAAGLRVLAAASGRWPNGRLPDQPDDLPLQFAGLVGLENPLKEGVAESVAACDAAGIRVLMLTGDHPETARAIARQAGIPAEYVAEGDVLAREGGEHLAELVGRTCVYARVKPEQKLRLVQMLKRQGAIVAMTGDGVNDAPALRAAHVGIAMGARGTDVAREAADLVLTRDDFSDILNAVRQSRRLFDNLSKAIVYIVAAHVPIAGLVILPLLFGWPELLRPAHVAFLEIVIGPLCGLAFESVAAEPDLMRRPPLPVEKPLFSLRTFLIGLAQGLALLASAGVLYGWLQQTQTPADTARATAFCALVLGNLTLMVNNRSPHQRHAGTWDGATRLAVAATLALLALTLQWPALRGLFEFGPLGIREWTAALLAAVTVWPVARGLRPLGRPLSAAGALPCGAAR